MKLNRKSLRRLILKEIKRNLREERTEGDRLSAIEQEEQVQQAMVDLAAMPNYSRALQKSFGIGPGDTYDLFNNIRESIIQNFPGYSDGPEIDVDQNQSVQDDPILGGHFFSGQLITVPPNKMESIEREVYNVVRKYSRMYEKNMKTEPIYRDANGERVWEEDMSDKQWKEYTSTPQWKKYIKQRDLILKKEKDGIEAVWNKYRFNPSSYMYEDQKHLYLVIPSLYIANANNKSSYGYSKGEPVPLSEIMINSNSKKGLVGAYTYSDGSVTGNFIIKISNVIELRDLFEMLGIDFDPTKMKTDADFETEEQRRKTRKVVGDGLDGPIYDDEN